MKKVSKNALALAMDQAELKIREELAQKIAQIRKERRAHPRPARGDPPVGSMEVELGDELGMAGWWLTQWTVEGVAPVLGFTQLKHWKTNTFLAGLPIEPQLVHLQEMLPGSETVPCSTATEATWFKDSYPV